MIRKVHLLEKSFPCIQEYNDKPPMPLKLISWEVPDCWYSYSKATFGGWYHRPHKGTKAPWRRPCVPWSWGQWWTVSVAMLCKRCSHPLVRFERLLADASTNASWKVLKMHHFLIFVFGFLGVEDIFRIHFLQFFSLREDVSSYRDFFFVHRRRLLEWKKRTKKGSFFSKQPSYALSALIGRFQTYFFFGNFLNSCPYAVCRCTIFCLS